MHEELSLYFGIITAVWKAQLNEVKINVFIAPVNMTILSIVRQVSGCQKRCAEGNARRYPSSAWFLKGAGPPLINKNYSQRTLILFKKNIFLVENSFIFNILEMKIW